MAAIYIPPWPLAEIYTTTLYPVEVVDSLGVSVVFESGAMAILPASEVATGLGLENGSYTQLRWFYTDGPYDSDVATSISLHDGSYTQLRWFYEDGPYDSEVGTSIALISGSLINKMVHADTPDEELQLSAVILTSCSMDLI